MDGEDIRLNLEVPDNLGSILGRIAKGDAIDSIGKQYKIWLQQTKSPRFSTQASREVID